jgi:RimJ/RimL family protein N-acetyltransferase
VIHTYPPLNLEVRTPRLTLAGATDELLERLVPVVRAGVADAAPWPFDDPMSLYAEGSDFTKFGTVSSFSWLAPGQRGRGIGTEMRAAVLHLAFAGLGACEAESDAFADNQASNQVSRALGYEPNGTTWDTRRGEVAPIQRWRLTRDAWERVRRGDIELIGVQACLPALGLV